jgi:hypothetical protein
MKEDLTRFRNTIGEHDRIVAGSWLTDEP